MKKLFVSQPMRGRSDEEILAERERMVAVAQETCGPVELIDSFFKNTPVNGNSLACLGESLKCMSRADVAIFAPGWESARGCRIERMAAQEYGVEIVEVST